tara:strand:- start:511 stop:822 length:312 start_codon:yes stop_codon:yes gene_type:complete
MRTKNKQMKTILPTRTQVNLPLIRKTLCGNEHKIPKDFTFNGQHKLFDCRGNDLGFWTLSVKAHVPHPHGRSASKHRIFAVVDGVEFPIGRLAQAHHPKHKKE